jgi:hypothetical protein
MVAMISEPERSMPLESRNPEFLIQPAARLTIPKSGEHFNT